MTAGAGEDERVAVRGAELAVRRTGSGPPVVWGHGFTSSRAAEDDLDLVDWSRLAERYELIRYDARGHGASTGTTDPVDYEYPNLGTDQLVLADALGIDRYAAGGVSMGAVTALWAAVRAPGRVCALVLAIPPNAWDARGDRGALYAAGAELIEAEGLAPMADLSTAERGPTILADRADELALVRRRHYLELDPTTLPAALRGIGGSDLPDLDTVATVHAPTLVLAWENDAAHPVETAARLDEALPDSTLEVAGSADDVAAWPTRVVAFLDDVLS